MLYVIYAEDVPDSLEKRLSVRPAHLARLQLLQDEGRLLTAGPMPAVDSNDPGAAGFTGSTVIAEFESLEAAQAGQKQTRTSQPACTRKSRFVRIKKYSETKGSLGSLFLHSVQRRQPRRKSDKQQTYQPVPQLRQFLFGFEVTRDKRA